MIVVVMYPGSERERRLIYFTKGLVSQEIDTRGVVLGWQNMSPFVD